ncbi:unnamed protein product, partial [Mesorhabditis spiculigera]
MPAPGKTTSVDRLKRSAEGGVAASSPAANKQSAKKENKKNFIKEEQPPENHKEEAEAAPPSVPPQPVDEKDYRARFCKQVLAMSPKKIFREYKEGDMAKIKPENYTYLTYQRNEEKNRYPDILCIDETRVVLKERDATNDYIHASWVKLPNGRKYICTQGPLKETLEDFWHMIVTEKSPIIVMLCNLEEQGESKCERYYPKEGKTLTFGKYSVKYKKELKAVTSDIPVAQYTITAGSTTHTVTHYMCQNWTDHACPVDAAPIIKLLKKVTGESKKDIITVHCSAGIGRTATFLGIEYASLKVQSESDFKMEQLLRELRAQRFHAVQGGTQYLFLHVALLQMWSAEGIVSPESCQSFFDSYKRTMTHMISRKK